MLLLRTILRRHCQIKRSFSDGGGSKMVRVRFAPSPTGPMHLGGLRTALYNYLFARSHGGKFILRIEDTDRLRTVPGAADQIERVLDRFGLERDEGPQESGAFGPYRQSERLHHYRHAAEQLVEADAAYPCFCTEQDLVYDDLVERCFEGDCIIIKADGYPTYHFANVVDDHLQQISHVLRGVEWRLSTNKHLQIYRAFQWTPPIFAHLPLLLSASGKHKLSKRNPSALIDFYSGYLPLAVINYLLRNGSGIRNYDAHKIYTIDELIAQFDIKCISTRPLNIDNDALDRYGRLTFANVDIDTVLIPEIRRQIANDVPTSSDVNNIDYMRKVAHFLRQNEEGFSSLTALTTGKFNFMFKRVINVDNCLTIASVDDIIRVIDATIEILRTSMSSTETIDRIRSIASNDDKLTNKTVFHLLRYALIDCESGPPIHELIQFFGPHECIKMLHHVKSLLHK